MTRRQKLRMTACIYALVAVALCAFSTWQVVRGLAAAKSDASTIQAVLSLAAAALLVIPAWGLWHDTRWGWTTAMLWACVFLVVTLGDKALPALLVLLLFLLLQDIAPKPIGAGPTPEQDVDRIADALGVRWEGQPLARIEEALAAGRKPEATRLYREHAGVTWNDANRVVAGWEDNAVERKLRCLAKAIESRAPAEVVARDGSG